LATICRRSSVCRAYRNIGCQDGSKGEGRDIILARRRRNSTGVRTSKSSVNPHPLVCGLRREEGAGTFAGVSEVTRILDRVNDGDAGAAEELLPLVYDELRRLAAQKLAHESPGRTLQPTALVHEAWLRLAGSGPERWDNRGHFFAAAAEAMRRILVENARRKARLKRGGQWERVPFEQVQVATDSDPATLLGLDEAIGRLAAEHPQPAAVVRLRFFVGLSLPEAAQALNVSESTAKRHWTFARAWLFQQLAGDA
jgi:RNA polymerase sigma factor (TIGR02999 family)